ncbi:DUF1573 domain-containing protein [Parabacteroides sp. AM08-6]|uniref:DUF1573 domain-containing protein n=1 Tax=Parabacteroides sp. AM08-6 TaxID=2292053 RepID=UPI000F00B191|nr:DUF1573 domain-containing protein [Parabacteroides sp. AM08-6]RHJ86570.1 DUF1573 domain-containing protein [Parabacteroides sp. AM08-6]
MKQIIFIFMAILLATGMASAEKKAVISAKETSYDFGTIKEADGKVSHTFKIENTGDKPLVITRVIASCGCTTPEWTKEPIAPGKTGEITITYNPKGRVAPFTKTVSVYSNGKVGSFILTIRGVVEE